MRYAFLILLFTLCPIFVFSQFTENIRAEYAYQRILGAHTIGQGVFQFESRFGIKHEENLDLAHINVLRYGLLENVDLNAMFAWGKVNYPEVRLTGSDLQLGFRLNLLEKRGYTPGIGFQYRVLLKIGKNAWRTGRRNIGSKLGIGVVQQILPRLNVIGHCEIDWDENVVGNTIDFRYGLVYAFHPFTIFIEKTHSDYDLSRVNGGLTYSIKNNWNLNISLGFGSYGINSLFGTAIRFGLKDSQNIPDSNHSSL